MITGVINLSGSQDSIRFHYASLNANITFDDALHEDHVNDSFQLQFVSHKDIPMRLSHCVVVDEKTSTTIFLVGHIYNLVELTNELDSDACREDRINHLYKKHGELFPRRCNGSFTIGIFQPKKKKYLLFKDHFGTIPLTIAKKDDSIYFSSDTMGLSRALYGDTPISKEYIYNRFCDYDETYRKTVHPNIQKLLPGHYFEISEGGLVEEKCYWHPDHTEEKQISTEVAKSTLLKLVQKSVQRRSSEEYLAGAHASGGLDSSLISVLAKKTHPFQNEFHAFSWSPSNFSDDDLPFDERDNIRELCKETGITPVFTNLTTDHYHSFIEEWRAPSEYVFEQTVQKNAKNIGLTVLFSGWGGDEFMAPRDEALYYETFMRLRFRTFFKLSRSKSLKKKVMHFVNNILFPTRRKKYLKYKLAESLMKYIKPGSFEFRFPKVDKRWYRSKKGHQSAMYDYHHLAQRCEDWYIQGQRIGLEYRYPLLDLELVEYSLSLPLHCFVGEDLDKPLMRFVAENHVPESITKLSKVPDPALMKNALKVQDEATKRYIQDIDRIAANDQLKFVNFEEVKKQSLAPLENRKKLNYFFYYLASTDAFIRQFGESN